MDTFTAIEQRRAVKHYDPKHEMTDEEINRLMSSALLSPTSFNIQNWRFVIVRDPDIRKKIRAAAWDQAQITEASMVIVLCGDLNSWAKEPQRYWKNAPEDVAKVLVGAIDQYYRDHPQIQRDEVMRSCGIAAQTIMLTAKAMGYDSCPMVGFDFDEVSKIIQLPEGHVVSMMITVGKMLKPARERGGQLPLEEVVTYDHF